MKTEIVVVGGGLAGSAAAIRLARAGCEVVLLERDSVAPHKVCGEFLSREALYYLDLLGLDVARLGAVPISAVRLACKSGFNEAKLPFQAMSLTRRRLDEELLQMVADAGARVMRGCRVQGIEREGTGWRALIEGVEPVSASEAFLATGKHDLRGRPRPKGRQSGLVAFKMYWRLAPAQAAALEGHVELMLYRGGYAGLQPVEDGMVNLCCLVQRRELQALGGRWERLLAAMKYQCGLLLERLHGAEAVWEKPLALSPIPYGYVRAASDGVWALGDQAAVIPSFTGDGMSIALHSGCLAAAMYLQGASAKVFQKKLRRELSNQVALSTVISQGLIWQPSRAIFTAVTGLRPGLLGAMAQSTRIPEAALLA